MTTPATSQNLLPYFTIVECDNCHHRYVPRSRNPFVCPVCKKPFLATVVSQFHELKERLIQISQIGRG